MDSKANPSIHLFPFYLRSEDFKYRATGYASARSLLVTADEAYALKMLAREKSKESVKRVLQQTNQRIEVDLDGLVARLRNARLIRSLNGQTIEPNYAGFWQVLGSRSIQNLRALPPKLAQFGIRALGAILPVSALVWLGKIKYQWLYPRAQRRAILAAVSAKMSALLPETTPAQRHHIAKQNFHITEVEKHLDLLVLMYIPHKRIGPWVLSRVLDLDISALTKALARGKGALIFHFHFGPIQLLSVVLTAMGFRVTVLGANIARAREADMLMRIVDNLGPAGVRKLYDALDRNEIVMFSPDPDVHPIGARKQTDVNFREKFAGTWQRSSQVETQLFGYRVHAYKGIAWLHAETQAPLFYAEIQSRTHQQLALQFQPFEPPPRADRKKRVWCQAIMDRIFGHYQERLINEPAQWEHWLSFFRYVNLPTKPKTPWMVLSKDAQDVLVLERSRVQVSPYQIQPFKDDKSLVIRMGTQGVMLTNPFGLAALAHLRQGITILDLQEALHAEGYAVNDTSAIFTFLRSVKATGLLAQVDGIPLLQPPVSPRRWLIHAVKTRVYPAVYRTIDRRLGLQIRQSLLPRLEWWMEGRFKYAAQRYQVANNMRLLMPQSRPARIQAAVRAYFKEEIHADLACQFTRRKVKDVFTWLDRYLEKHIAGLEALEIARAQGKGIIFAGYHFGLYWLLPALLWRRGFRLHVVIGTVLQSEDMLADVGPKEFPDAQIHFHDTSIQSIAKLPAFLARGEAVLIYADSLSRFAPEVSRQVHKTWGKSARTQRDVSLLGHAFPQQPGVGWLHAQTGAPVVPSFLYRHPRSGRIRLAFENPIQAGPDTPLRLGIQALKAHTVHQELFEILGHWIKAYPEQWRNLLSFPQRPMKRTLN